MKEMYVYILLCSDDSYYIGVTNNLDRRISEHEIGIDNKCYTFQRRPLKLVYYEMFSNPDAAIRFEKKIKGWTRAKKEALIIKDFDLLKKLAKKKFT